MVTLVQSISAASTLVAALITGFGAAALKHRWDAQAERLRWTRERLKATEEEQLGAFSEYIAARPSRAVVQQRILAARRGDVVDLETVFAASRLAAARLLILLDSGEHRQVVEDDQQVVEDWIVGASDALSSISTYPDIAVNPSLFTLARKLREQSQAG